MLLAYGVQHITKRLRHDGLQATQYLARLAYWHDLTDPGAYSQQPEAAPLPVLRLQLPFSPTINQQPDQQTRHHRHSKILELLFSLDHLFQLINGTFQFACTLSKADHAAE